MKLTELLTVKNLAEIFQTSEVTVHRWNKAGMIPAPIRLGRRAIRWRAEDIEAFIEGLNNPKGAEDASVEHVAG
jgi:predicted DNA-binding transcriptional regulator AlpA